MDKITELIASLEGKSVYIDTNIFIYFLDQNSRYFHTVAQFFQACSDGLILGIAGDAVFAEVMIHPYRSHDAILVEQIRAFFKISGIFSLVRHDDFMFEYASQISAVNNIKLIDALHYTTAIKSGCSHIITNDM